MLLKPGYKFVWVCTRVSYSFYRSEVQTSVAKGGSDETSSPLILGFSKLETRRVLWMGSKKVPAVFICSGQPFLCVAARRSIANFYQPGTTKGPAGVLGRVFRVVNSRENRFCAITAYGFTEKENWEVRCGVHVTLRIRWWTWMWRLMTVEVCSSFLWIFLSTVLFLFVRISTLSGMPHKLIPHIACPLTSLSFHWSYCWWRSNPFFPSVPTKHPVNYNNGIKDVYNYQPPTELRKLQPSDYHITRWGIYQTVASHARCFWIWRCSLRGHHVGFHEYLGVPWIP